ncbi:mitochondrial poly(A) polymerase isoform X2 [Megachile rotundata]|uniref:mitochondrial poly(A) polymerase isoform X2 n=1 Tax=Megachile rotundata TaxID=143995 RepID=UPI003FD5388A
MSDECMECMSRKQPEYLLTSRELAACRYLRLTTHAKIVKGSIYGDAFHRMITERQNQAMKSIIIKLNSFEAIDAARQCCASYGQVIKAFPYNTINDECFMLIEFDNYASILKLKNSMTSEVKSFQTIGMVSPIYRYYADKSEEQKSSATITYYKTFTIPKRTDIVKKLKEIKSIDGQMVALYHSLKFSEVDIRLRFFTAAELTYYVNRLFCNINVLPFGSSVNGFGQRGCDLDLVCSVSGTKNESAQKLHYLTNNICFDSKVKHQQFLEMVYTILNTCVPTISNAKRILNARVPILKFSIPSSNMQCDLSGPNEVALYMSKLLYIFSEIDCRVKPLVCTIRKWAKNHRITREIPGQWITNFSLTLLIIFYLQRIEILPPIAVLTSAQNKSGWKVSSSLSLQSILRGFFQFYSNFDFSTQAISIWEGKTKIKLDVSPIYIQNPFNESLNVAKNINDIQLERLIHHFRDALNLLHYEECSILHLLKYDSNEQNSTTDDNTVQQNETAIEEIFDLTNSIEEKKVIKS